MLVSPSSKLLWLSFATFMLVFALFTSEAGARSLIFATANSEGADFRAGVKISTLLNSHLTESEHLVVTAINTTGSGENIHLLSEGRSDLAILSGVTALQAYRGQGFYLDRPMKNMSVIAVLWNNVVHFVVRNEFVKNKDLNDLKGLAQSFSLGGMKNGTLGSEQVIFDALDINKHTDFTARYLDFSPSIDALLKNQVAGAVFTGRVPHEATVQLFAAEGDRISLLNVTADQYQKLNSNNGVWSRHILKAWSYRNQNEEVSTVAYPNILVVSNRLTDADVYQLTKCFYEHLPQFSDMLESTDAAELAGGLSGVDLPVHPGAQRYFREQGFNIVSPR